MDTKIEVLKADIDYLFDRISRPIEKGESGIAHFFYIKGLKDAAKILMLDNIKREVKK